MGEMAQLRGCTAQAEDPSPVPSTHIRCRPLYLWCQRDVVFLASMVTWANSYMQTHMLIIKVKSFKKKWSVLFWAKNKEFCPCGLRHMRLWKRSSGLSHTLLFPEGARSVYHQLFMSSLLMDPKYKKLFAVRFAKVSRVFIFPVLMINKLFKE